MENGQKWAADGWWQMQGQVSVRTGDGDLGMAIWRRRMGQALRLPVRVVGGIVWGLAAVGAGLAPALGGWVMLKLCAIA
ncbi:MAG: hypothetical protein CVV27_03285 [Candidatus Melainabacteria bacterium HGW-Melainabacteria-1]|nr:MAG: hypothetical protein CVV27_03285 [Candidatus Melainabacteria bacterium HGW-Melainabacteria-1]